MITAVIVILAIYLAVRFTLSETSQKLGRIRDVWQQAICTSRRTISDDADTGDCKQISLKDAYMFTDRSSEQPGKPATPTRRRTGAVNGKNMFKRPKVQKLSRSQLRLPFMDTGLYQGNVFSYSSSSPNNGIRRLSRDIKGSNEKDEQASNNTVADDNILNMFKLTAEDRNSSIFTRIFHHVSFILQRNTPIEYPDVSEKVLASERVKCAINTAVEEIQGENPDDSRILMAEIDHKQRAVNILRNMRSCISSFLLKIAAWVMYKLLGRMLDGIEIHREQIQTIKRASQNNVPIVYLPLHRSHLDYILVTFILYMNDLRAPLVAAGNNLMIPFFGSLLRGLGAFFIKRKLDPQQGQRDFVYRAILHTYMEESLTAGHSLEFFIEGGRSRTGKAVLPKAGLLSIVVDTLVSGGITDAYIVPIAMSYEKLLDGNFISEQMGKPKQMESFSSAIQAIWRTLHSNFGTVRVDFCQPFSLKEFLLAAEYSYTMPAKNPLPWIPNENNCIFNHTIKNRRRSEYGTEIVTEDHRQVIKDLADYIVYDAFNANALMTTNVLAFLLMTKHRKGTTFNQLVSSMNWLREEIRKRNRILNFNGESSDLIRRASVLLSKRLVATETIQMEWSSGTADTNMRITFYKPTVTLPEVLELQYYANAVLPVFLLESVVINAAYAVAADISENLLNGGDGKVLLRGQIIKQSLELCSILQYEFIFSPPGTSLCTVLSATIDDLIANELLQVVEGCEDDNMNLDSLIITNVLDGSLHQEYLADDEESQSMSQHLKMSSTAENYNMLQFLKCILSPFLESYWLVCCALPNLVNSEMDEASLLQEVKRLGHKKIHLGLLNYEECLGLDTLKNAVKLFDSWKIIKSTCKNSKKNSFILHPSYNNKNALREIIARIEKYNS